MGTSKNQDQFWKLVTEPSTTREQIQQMERNADDKEEVVLAALARKAVHERFGGWRAASEYESAKTAAEQDD